jgi:hypothetical protein
MRHDDIVVADRTEDSVLSPGVYGPRTSEASKLANMFNVEPVEMILFSYGLIGFSLDVVHTGRLPCCATIYDTVKEDLTTCSCAEDRSASST